ncbi:MAG: hypothetical protein FRX48_05176 [Lasallia pustulata]|uniref:Heterokaryon incompatibility domain-containing protein n=1 Tax=Lasallia pustulata TaxID=136370 RepID=A0A5M8PQM2_9LECA|nr:MAG: hypothetical protein FRX48_05176 [Lasallia pustulata]
MDQENCQQLCEVCEPINFGRYFTNQIDNCVTQYKETGADANALKLGYLKDIYRRSSSCPFCRLVVMAICRNDASWSFTPDQRVAADLHEEEQIECWIYSYCFADYNPEEPGSEKVYRIGIAARQSEDDLPEDDDFVGSIQLLAEDARQINRSELFHGRIVDTTKVDMNLASNWLRICESEHGDKCEKLGPAFDGRDMHLYNLILIDVKNLYIFQTPDELAATLRFICLSYCWPPKKPFMLTQANFSELLQKGSIESKMELLPDAIRDAIHCVSDLGETYLWVDSLCII